MALGVVKMTEDRNLQKLRNVWNEQSSVLEEASVKKVLEMSNSLKRKIVIRNYIEWMAALTVVSCFSYRAWTAMTMWSLLMNIEIACAAVFIGFYIWRRGRYQMRVDRDLSSVDFIQNERVQIQKQIKILSTIKYWYVIPILLGVVGLVAEQIALKWNPSDLPWIEICQLIVVVLLGIGISFANEVYGVRKLKHLLNQLPQV